MLRAIHDQGSWLVSLSRKVKRGHAQVQAVSLYLVLLTARQIADPAVQGIFRLEADVAEILLDVVGGEWALHHSFDGQHAGVQGIGALLDEVLLDVPRVERRYLISYTY